MKAVLAVALVAFSTSVFADPPFETPPPFGDGASSAVSNATSSSRAQQQQGQLQGQLQGQVQGQQQGQNVSGGNVSLNTTYQRSAPSFGLPAAFPTAVCQGTLAAGFSFFLGGGAAAGSITVEECMKLETIRVGVHMMQNGVTSDHILGMQEANTQVYCSTKYGSQTSLCKANAVQTAKEELARPVQVEAAPEVTLENSFFNPMNWFN